MMPQNSLSISPQFSPFLSPDDRIPFLTQDYEMGGIALRDPSQGLQVQTWTFSLSLSTGAVTASAPSIGSPIPLFARAGTTEISGTFDQNMNPCVAFMQDDVAMLWLYDPTVHDQIFTAFQGNIRSPRVSMDDKRSRQTQQGANDIIFAYVSGTNLCMRMQRERWTVEHVLGVVPANYSLSSMGMNRGNRMQFRLDST